MSDMRLIVVGAGGRMGRTLVKAIAESAGVTLAGALEQASSPLIGQDSGVLAGLSPNGIALTHDAGRAAQSADGFLDFTTPKASAALSAITADAKTVHVIGSTGFEPEQEAQVAEAARRATIVKSGNMSLGVNLLAALVKRVARTLGDEFDIEIVEMHHNKKVDAPSGTALLLGQAAAAGRNVELARRRVSGRDGVTGARRAGDIGFAALRGGTVVGDHSVIFAGTAERIELTHKADDRMIFARGAIRAALWARGKPPGLYSMADVLSLTDI